MCSRADRSMVLPPGIVDGTVEDCPKLGAIDNQRAFYTRLSILGLNSLGAQAGALPWTRTPRRLQSVAFWPLPTGPVPVSRYGDHCRPRRHAAYGTRPWYHREGK